MGIVNRKEIQTKKHFTDTSRLKSCGVCGKLDIYISRKCYLCTIDICDICSTWPLCLFDKSPIVGYGCLMCKLSYNLSFDHVKAIYMYSYCFYCDKFMSCENFNTSKSKRRCNKCKNKKIECRKLLPHYRAMLEIEKFILIRDIAQIIFDYYYEPRRYFSSEF